MPWKDRKGLHAEISFKFTLPDHSVQVETLSIIGVHLQSDTPERDKRKDQLHHLHSKMDPSKFTAQQILTI